MDKKKDPKSVEVFTVNECYKELDVSDKIKMLKMVIEWAEKELVKYN